MRNTDRYDLKDLSLAGQGKDRVGWAGRFMPVLGAINRRFKKDKPLKGIRISACLHVTAETANLILGLHSGGADVRLCASNPLSTQDDVAAYLVKSFGIPVYAMKGENSSAYHRHILFALLHKPLIVMDDGADLVTALCGDKKDLSRSVIGGTEETTSGVIRLRSMARRGVLQFPVISVNDAKTKHFFDNRYGTGQSALDGIIRSTNILIAGTKVVVCGYGWCGRGVAIRAKGLGADVIVTEVDPIKALEAVMDGYRVMPMAEAAKIGEVFITLTAGKSAIGKEHFGEMRDGVILCNAGHFNVEIDILSLEAMSVSKRGIREMIEEYKLTNGKRIYLLAEGRLVNLACADGHPPSVMDMSFANQALAVEYLLLHHKELENKIYPMPDDLDREIAELKLRSMGVKIDKLTKEQINYLNTWSEGT